MWRRRNIVLLVLHPVLQRVPQQVNDTKRNEKDGSTNVNVTNHSQLNQLSLAAPVDVERGERKEGRRKTGKESINTKNLRRKRGRGSIHQMQGHHHKGKIFYYFTIKLLDFNFSLSIIEYFQTTT